jgi:hypothetical protein
MVRNKNEKRPQATTREERLAYKAARGESILSSSSVGRHPPTPPPNWEKRAKRLRRSLYSVSNKNHPPMWDAQRGNIRNPNPFPLGQPVCSRPRLNLFPSSKRPAKAAATFKLPSSSGSIPRPNSSPPPQLLLHRSTSCLVDATDAEPSTHQFPFVNEHAYFQPSQPSQRQYLRREQQPMEIETRIYCTK